MAETNAYFARVAQARIAIHVCCVQLAKIQLLTCGKIKCYTTASVYPVPFEGNPYFLIDSELHPGTSGSPVITQPSIWVVKTDESELFEEPQYRLIGIHSAAYGDLKLNVVWFADLVAEVCQRALIRGTSTA